MRRRLTFFGVPFVAMLALGALPSAAAGIAVKVPTWTGVDIGRFPVAVVASDLNGDARPDLAWGRDDFSQDSITVQLTGANGKLGQPQTYPAALDVQDIASGDLNGDGRRDLVAVSQGADGASHTIDLYLNTGTGAFTHTTRTGGNGPARVMVADLNADGNLDLALTNFGFAQGNTLGVMLGHGNGTFDPEVRYTIGNGVFGVAAADLTGDGAPDLAVGWSSADSTDYHVTVLQNNGNGVFTPGTTLDVTTSDGFAPFWTSVAAADFDGDGHIDLAATSGGTLHLVVFRNLGNLSFSPTTYEAGGGPTRLLAADTNADGRPDLVEAAQGDSFAGHVVLLRNLGGGSFGQPVRVDAGPQPYGVALADMNGDRRLDLIAANRGSGTGSIDPQTSNGSFAAAPIYEALPDLIPLDSASADFDGDGRPDMALSQLDLFSDGGDRVVIMHNDGASHMALAQTLPSGTDSNPKSVIAADLNGDARPDLAWTPEISSLQASYPLEVALNNGNGTFGQPVAYPVQTCGTGAVTAGDVNGDGIVDLIVANNRGGPGGFCDSVSRTVRVALGNGNGTFQADFGVQIGLLTEMAAAADVNGDGRADIVSTAALTHVSLALAGGGFAAAVPYNARGTELAVADMNADGHPDVVTADGSTSFVYVLRNSGNGSFTVQGYEGEQVTGLANGRGVAVGDINSDGLLDVAVADVSGQNAGVFYGRPGGLLGPELRYGTHAGFNDVNLADYNGDGRLDLAGPGYLEGQGIFPEHSGVSVLLDILAPCISTAGCEDPLGPPVAPRMHDRGHVVRKHCGSGSCHRSVLRLHRHVHPKQP